MEYVDAKTIVTNRKDTSWFGARYNMNIYRGCCHGCIYCDSRSDCYRVEDFDTVKAKKDALAIVRNDLRRKVKNGVVATGAMSDPYNPFEETELLTRHSLELINAYEFGVAIATKSDLVTRDLDLLREIKEHSPVLVKMTITAADDQLSGKLEPNVAVSSKRFAALRQLSDGGIYCGVLLMPVLPFLEDNEENIGEIVDRTAESGARFIFPAFGVTLRQNQREHFLTHIEALFPGMREKYERTFGTRYNCTSPKAKKLYEFFAERCREHGLLFEMDDIINGYQMGYETEQLRLF